MLKMENREREHWWVVAVESSLEGETRADKPGSCLIHPVPKFLVTENSQVFYLPRVISLGPYHFQMNSALDDNMELLKSEVARKMDRESISGLKSVVKKFKEQEMQERIKDSYAKEFKLSSEVCAWMIVRDACFVLEVLDNLQTDPKNSGPASIANILSSERHHPLFTEIVKDILKMENQLPFWALEEVRFDIMGSKEGIWFESALKNLSPIEVADGRNWDCNGESHILQLLHDYIVDGPVTDSSGGQSRCRCMCHTICGLKSVVCEVLHSIPKDPGGMISHGWNILSESFCSPEKGGLKNSKRKSFTNAIILVLLFPVIVILLILGIVFVILDYIKNYISPKEEIGKHIPTVSELKRGGVRFKKLAGTKIGISHIEFKESNCTLYLPMFKADYRSEVIFRNLVALELCSKEEQKPITSYAILMKDLIKTSGDVSILRREGIITSEFVSDDEIAELWVSIVTSIEIMPRYDSIDKASSSINRHPIKRRNVLRAQYIGLLIEFMMVHCSKPWVFLSLLGAIMLLGLTFIQVLCLFISCQHK